MKIRVCINLGSLMQQLVRTISRFPSLIKCLNIWLTMSITISWTVTRGIIRFPLLRGPRKDYFHMSIWDICLSSNAFRLVQCPSNISMLHVESFLWYGRTIIRYLHGWFLHLWRFIHSMSPPFRLVLQCCAEKNLTLNWEKCHFMVRHRIVLSMKSPRKELKWIEPRLRLC